MDPIHLDLESVDEAKRLLFEINTIEELPQVSDTILGPEDADIGILLQHGFSGSNVEMLYLANLLGHNGFRVLMPILPGHGTSAKDLIGLTYQDWIKKHEQGLQFLRNEKPGRKLFAIGHSLGGSLSLLLGSKNKHLSGVISIAGPIRFKLGLRLLVKIFGHFNITIPYEEFEFHDERLYENPGIKNFDKTYGKVPMKAFGEIFKLLDLVYNRLPLLSVPVSLMYSKYDNTVPPYHVKEFVTKCNSKHIELNWFYNSNHVIVIDSDKDDLANKVIEFVNRISELDK